MSQTDASAPRPDLDWLRVAAILLLHLYHSARMFNVDDPWHVKAPQLLPAHRFCRVHRGALVALDAVQRLEPWDHGDGLLVLKDGSHCTLSRTRRKGFLERWGLKGE